MRKKKLNINGSLKAIFAALSIVVMTSSAQAQHVQMTPVLNAYFKMVFAGDTSGAAALFASEPEDHGSKMLAQKFQGRFIERDNGLDLSGVESPVVRNVVELFQSYWRDALMQTDALDVLEADLKSNLDRILVDRGFQSAIDDEDEDLLLENVEALIREEGYFAQSGRTPPLLDVMIWATNEVVPETIELTDSTYEVDVNHLDEFISYGWSNFAAFGMTSTGGWAKADGLYCLCRHYDLESERFKLSFLKHEARHFADLRLYPELQPSDLEYRSKLTELAFSDEGTYGLVTYFQNAANRVANAPHPLANWYVIEGLSAQLLDGKWPDDAGDWTSVPKEKIRQAARRLLEEHDALLADLGPKSAKGVVNL